jgi:hypothetical protein
MTRKHDQHPAAKVATIVDEDQNREELTESAPDDLSSLDYLLDQKRTRAEAARRLEDEKRGQADAQMAAAQAEADRILREARTESATLTAESRSAGYLAEGLEGDVRGLAVAKHAQGQGDEADQLAAALSTERGQLLAQIAELCETAERLQGEMREVDAQLTGARVSADVDLVTSLRARLAGLEDVAASVDGQLAASRGRSAQIGDGTASFPGELIDALGASERHHAEVRRILNAVYPDRPEAVHDRLVDDIAGSLAAGVARMAEEAKPKPSARRRSGFAGNHY